LRNWFERSKKLEKMTGKKTEKNDNE